MRQPKVLVGEVVVNEMRMSWDNQGIINQQYWLMEDKVGES